MDFAIPVNNQRKRTDRQILRYHLKAGRNVEHKGDDDVTCCWRRSNGSLKRRKETGETELQKTIQIPLDYSTVKISEDPKQSPKNLIGWLFFFLVFISCLGVYYNKWWLSYPLHASVKLHPMTMHLNS